MLQFCVLLKDMYAGEKNVSQATLFLKASESWRLPWIVDFYDLQWFRGTEALSAQAR